MTTTDNQLIEGAKALAGESYSTASYLAVATTEVANILVTDTALAGEIGTREALDITRTSNSVDFTAIRSGADVIDTSNGDDIKSSGTMTASSGGILLSGATHGGITQTTNFDLEFIYQQTVDRP